MTYSSPMNEDGEITISPEILERLGLTYGDSVEFYFENNQVFLRSAESEENPVSK